MCSMHRVSAALTRYGVPQRGQPLHPAHPVPRPGPCSRGRWSPCGPGRGSLGGAGADALTGVSPAGRHGV